jgi:hypothetical protein
MLYLLSRENTSSPFYPKKLSCVQECGKAEDIFK